MTYLWFQSITEETDTSWSSNPLGPPGSWKTNFAFCGAGSTPLTCRGGCGGVSLDPKSKVKPQHEAQNSADRTVMLDMNKAGSGGFFSFDEQDVGHGGSRLTR